jgi:hypothetical protein
MYNVTHIIAEGTKMKSRFFPKKDEVILSTFTAFIIVSLVYQGFFSLWNTQSHAIFKKDTSYIVKK